MNPGVYTIFQNEPTQRFLRRLEHHRGARTALIPPPPPPLRSKGRDLTAWGPEQKNT